MGRPQQIAGQKRNIGFGRIVFSFHQSKYFVERFVENMLNRNLLIYNASFIIFNNSSKLYVV